MRVGVISDTHGMLRTEAVTALQGAELIVHAGDVGLRRVLEALEDIAPVQAVRGNIDRPERAGVLPFTQVVQAGDRLLYVLHDLSTLDVDPAAAGFAAVISGHSHRPSIHHRDSVLYLNPGSAGPRRFNLPVTVALIEVTREGLEAQLVPLEA